MVEKSVKVAHDGTILILTAMVFGNRHRSHSEKTGRSRRKKNDRSIEKKKSLDGKKSKKRTLGSKPQRRKIPVVLKEALKGDFKGLPPRLKKAFAEIARDMPMSMLLIIFPVTALGISVVFMGLLFFIYGGGTEVSPSSRYGSEPAAEMAPSHPKEKPYLRPPSGTMLSENPISMAENSVAKNSSLESASQEITFLESKADMEFAAQNYKEAEGAYQTILRASQRLNRNAVGKSSLLRKIVFRIFASQLAQGRRAEASVIFAQFEVQNPAGEKSPEWYYGRALMAYIDKDAEGAQEIVKAAQAQNFLHTEIYESTLRQMGYGEDEGGVQ